MKCYIIYSDLTIWMTDGDFENKDQGGSVKYENLDELMFDVVKNKKHYDRCVIMEERTTNAGSEFIQRELNYLLLKYTRVLGIM